jgi:alpha-ribazole phosphatase/probable phosphoglycerate mutase
MVTTLYIVRHGQTEGSDKRRYKGTIDVPLSKGGIEQAEKLSRFFGRNAEGVKAVYSSALKRALGTAEPIAGALGLEPQVVEGLRERHFGEWEGMTFEEIEAKYPDAFSLWAGDPLSYSPVGGESTLEVRDRVVDAVEGLIKRHEGDTFVIVAHGGVNRIALCHYTGLPLENIFRLEQDFACVNVLEFHGGFPVLKLLNHTPALEGLADPKERLFG